MHASEEPVLLALSLVLQTMILLSLSAVPANFPMVTFEEIKEA